MSGGDDSVLLIGGYGAVGIEAARAIRRLYSNVKLVLAGRNRGQAAALAAELGHAEGIECDLGRRLSAERDPPVSRSMFKVDAIVGYPRGWPNMSSSRSPNDASNTSTSASVTARARGADIAQALASEFGCTPFRILPRGRRSHPRGSF